MFRTSKFRWGIVALLFLASALNFFDRQVLSVLAPTILEDLRMTNVDYSYIVAAFTLSYSIMFTLGGRIIDYLGTRIGMGFTVAFWTLSSVLHAAALNPIHLGVFRFMLGIGEGGCFPGAAKGALEWFPRRERSLAMGIATTGGSAIGALVAPPVIVWTAVSVGWRGAFVVTGILGAVWVLLWFLLYRLPRESHFTTPEEVDYILSDQEDSGAAAVETSSRTPWKAILRLREVWGLIVTRFLLDPVFYFYMFWIPQYLSQERGASLETIGNLTWIPFFTLGLSSVGGGAVSDRLVRSGWPVNRARKVIMAIAAFVTPVSMLCVYAPNAEIAVALMSVLMFAHGFWMTNYMTLIGDLFPVSTVGTVVGMSGTAGGAGGFLSSLFVGKLIETYTFTPAFIACGVLYPIGLLIILLTVPRIARLELGLGPRDGTGHRQ